MLKKLLKNIFTCFKLQTEFEVKKRLNVTTFISKTGFSKTLLLISFISFRVDSALGPIMVNVLDTKKEDKPKNRSVADHSQCYNHSTF